MAIRDQGGGEAHECPTCGEEFPTEDELRRHVDDSHPGDQRASDPDAEPVVTEAHGSVM